MIDSGQIILFQTQGGETKVEVRLANESVWLTADQMAELFVRAVKAFRVLSGMSMRVMNLGRKELWQQNVTIKKYVGPIINLFK